MSVWLQESVAGAVGPTLPGGLVVRIRRSHRRGPGSIPGQGSLSSSFTSHLPTLTCAPFYPTLLPQSTQQQHNFVLEPHTRKLAHAQARSPPCLPAFPETSSASPAPSPHAAHSFRTLPLRATLSALRCSARTHQLCPSPARTRCLPCSSPHHAPAHSTSGPSSHAPGSQTLVHSWSLLNRTPSPHRLLLGLEQTL